MPGGSNGRASPSTPGNRAAVQQGRPGALGRRLAVVARSVLHSEPVS